MMDSQKGNVGEAVQEAWRDGGSAEKQNMNSNHDSGNSTLMGSE
jgi:hypothetical protein